MVNAASIFALPPDLTQTQKKLASGCYTARLHTTLDAVGSASGGTWIDPVIPQRDLGHDSIVSISAQSLALRSPRAT